MPLFIGNLTSKRWNTIPLRVDIFKIYGIWVGWGKKWYMSMYVVYYIQPMESFMQIINVYWVYFNVYLAGFCVPLHTLFYSSYFIFKLFHYRHNIYSVYYKVYRNHVSYACHITYTQISIYHVFCSSCFNIWGQSIIYAKS